MTFKTAHTFELVFPQANNGTPNSPDSHHHAYIEGFLSSLFGGFTSWHANGGWLQNDLIVREAVTVYRASIVTEDHPQQYRNMMLELASNLKRMARQDAVFLVYRAEQIAII